VKRLASWHDYITINIYWLGLTTIVQTNGLIIPLLVQRFVGTDQQATAFGSLRLYTLMVALLVQALTGMLSDHSSFRWGKRRPFILIGTLLNLICMPAIGLSPSYWFLFGATILSQVAINTAQSAEQGLIPDLAPKGLRGRFSGVKAVLEIPLPTIIVSLAIGPLIGAGNMWGGILVALGVLSLSTFVTMFVREPAPRQSSAPLNWKPFGRLLIMTLTFTALIQALGAGIKRVSNLLEDVASTVTTLPLLGGAGLLAMLAAIGIGVWASVRIGIGSKAARRCPSFSWWVINRLAFLVGVNNLSSFAIYFLQMRLGLEGAAAAKPASRLMLVVGIQILLSAVSSGWIADRLGHKRLVFLSGITATLGAVGIILAPTLPLIYLGGCVIGAATGVFFTANWALGTSVIPREESGRYLGIANLAGAGAGAIGASIGGPIADHFARATPQTPELGYVLLFSIYGMLFLLSSLLLIQLRDA